MTSFGKRLKELRTEKNITQRAMAEILSISVPTLSHWECDYQEPAFKDLVALGKFFNVSTDYLLGLEDDFGARTATTAAPSNDTFTTEERNFIKDFRKLPKGMRDILRTTLDAMLNEKEETID